MVNESDTCDGGSARFDMGECRMDLVDSELSYMGYEATESYGITWKVSVCFCYKMYIQRTPREGVGGRKKEEHFVYLLS